MLKQDGCQVSQRGFTLIELLVVVAIIAILTAIAVPSLLYAREKSKQSACNAMYTTLDSTIVNLMENWEKQGLSYHQQKVAFDKFGKTRTEKNPRNRERLAYSFRTAMSGGEAIPFAGDACVVYYFLGMEWPTRDIYVSKWQWEDGYRRGDRFKVN